MIILLLVLFIVALILLVSGYRKKKGTNKLGECKKGHSEQHFFLQRNE